jgi:CheY-like chemotaxis protein
VLLNLLTNGVKYTPSGGSVTIACTSTEQNIVRLEVRDTGIGIASDKLSRVFTPFDRLGAEQSTIEGTGLGLALSQRLVQAMHGSIGVESKPGEGSTFWVELSRTKSPFETVAPAGLADLRSGRLTALKKTTILYIEDNHSNLTLVEQIVREEPQIELLTAMQGRIGLDLARQHLPDLILLDLHLPDLPGWEVLAQLRSDDATRHIPTIVLSADATPGQIKRLRDAGALDYLTKPIDVAQFCQLLEKTAAQKEECVAA